MSLSGPRIATAGRGDGEFNYPMGVAVDRNDNVWVADSWNSRVQEFDRDGEFLRNIGSKGTENGQFIDPAGIASDAEGNIWVVDLGDANKLDWDRQVHGLARVQKFDSQGHYLIQFGSFGKGDGQFRYPRCIAISN